MLDGVVLWMKGGAGGVIQWESLLRKICFPFMSADFLLRVARGLLPESTGLEGLVLEADMLKGVVASQWHESSLRYMDAKVLVPSRGRGLNWAEYLRCGEKRLTAEQEA